MTDSHRLELVVALDRNGLIGRGGRLPWPRLKSDMRRFANLTHRGVVVMGRRTFDSLPYPPLPGRYKIVLSRRPGWATNVEGPLCYCPTRGIDRARSLDAITLHPFTQVERFFVIGGAEVFAAALADPRTRLAHVTHVDRDFGEGPGDVRFPGGPGAFGPGSGWEPASDACGALDGDVPMTFATYARRT